jgi:hypothetical protein
MPSTAKIGQIVRFHTGAGAGQDAYYVPAIVTMTPQEWQPGYRDSAGTWVPTDKVASPKPGTVHLHIFWPTGSTATPEQSDKADVAYGAKDQCWSELTIGSQS